MNTRERIIFAFRQLAKEKGFYSATIDELASRNNMSKRTIYRYFKSKEEIIEAVMRQFMSQTEEVVLEALNSSENPIEKIACFVKVVTERLKNESPLVLSDLQRYYPNIWEKVERFRAEKIKYIISIMVQGSKAGYFKEINPKIVTASFLATVRAVVNPTFMLENNLTPEETLRTVLNTFLYGIVADNKIVQADNFFNP